MSTIAVLGANGRLSNMVARKFLTAGHQVIAITRTGTAKGFGKEVEQRAADAMDRDGLIRATRGADIIFNGLNPAYTDWKKYVMPLGENVMAAASYHGALHLFPGNIYNYGHAIAAHVDDDAPMVATTRKGAMRNQLENLFQEQADQNKVQTIILRAGDFYGGTLTGSWFDLVVAAKIAKGTFTYPGPMTVPHSWAYLPDLASSFVKLAAHAGELNPIEAFLFAGHTMTGAQLKRHCEQAADGALKHAGVPWPLLRLGGLVVPMLREISEMAYLWKTAHELDGQKLQCLIGDVPGTDPKSAVAQALSDLSVVRPAEQARTLHLAA